ncbi:Ldh family oxidoreductase [Aliisedimentitalea scapharcae]|uniref:Ldh family oxidoreductase n=1 Tax=Aliisedimentitalea scapharcae TaxID=1524259 RepID=A0ABZ2XV64_9RHOB
MTATRSKLDLQEDQRVNVSKAEAVSCMVAIFERLGNTPEVARCVAEHLAETSLSGMESHGVMRTLQYAEQMQNGYLSVGVDTQVIRAPSGATHVDGGGGIGIPAMVQAYETGMQMAVRTGVSALAIRNVGHTGRHGAFADKAGQEGFLTICVGGGNRKNWPQVAPHGGAKGLLPTNPWCIGIPGGARGPVVLDFATSKIAGGWIYAARSAGAQLPDGCLIDRDGNPSRDPEAYFSGGAILPAGGHKGYGLALMGEMIGEAMLGPSSTECNWLLVTLRCDHFRETSAMEVAAEAVLSDMRNCPPAPGFDCVEVPGERERDQYVKSGDRIAIPKATWRQIQELEAGLKA